MNAVDHFKFSLESDASNKMMHIFSVPLISYKEKSLTSWTSLATSMIYSVLPSNLSFQLDQDQISDLEKMSSGMKQKRHWQKRWTISVNHGR